MRFYYDKEPTIQETIGQAMGFSSVCWEKVELAGEFESTLARNCLDSAIEAVYGVVTYELSRLLDSTGEAKEWNEAIEAALVRIEALK